MLAKSATVQRTFIGTLEFRNLSSELGIRGLRKGVDGSAAVSSVSRRYKGRGAGHSTQLDPIGLAGGLNSYGFAEGDPVNFADPFGLCPERESLLNRLFGRRTPVCKTRDEAAVIALEARPAGGWREWCGEIIAADGGFRFTAARPGTAINCGIHPYREDYEGAYHTHPDPTSSSQPEEFSSDDMRVGDDYQKPVYVKTPSGAVKKYAPDPAKQRRGKQTVIRSPN